MINCNNVLFSRVSYRRNIKEMLFVNKLSDMEQAIAICRSLSEIFGDELEFKSLKNMPLTDCLKLQEAGLFTKELIENKDISAYAIGDKGEKIYINEQDHIRMEVKKDGFALDECFSRANELDDIILDKLEMAFDNNIGYLTANPMLVGTGMEISCGLFLPALTHSAKLKKIGQDLLGDEFELLSLDFEKWNEKSPFVLVKNKYTFGYKENEFAEKIYRIVEKIVELEKIEENNQFNLSASTLVDTIYRKYGITNSAYRMSFREAEENIGYIFWGINLKVLILKKKLDICALLAKIKENNLGKMQNIKEQEKQRAKYLSNILTTSLTKGDVDV